MKQFMHLFFISVMFTSNIVQAGEGVESGSEVESSVGPRSQESHESIKKQQFDQLQAKKAARRQELNLIPDEKKLDAQLAEKAKEQHASFIQFHKDMKYRNRLDHGADLSVELKNIMLNPEKLQRFDEYELTELNTKVAQKIANESKQKTGWFWNNEAKSDTLIKQLQEAKTAIENEMEKRRTTRPTGPEQRPESKPKQPAAVQVKDPQAEKKATVDTALKQQEQDSALNMLNKALMQRNALIKTLNDPELSEINVTDILFDVLNDPDKLRTALDLYTVESKALQARVTEKQKAEIKVKAAAEQSAAQQRAADLARQQEAQRIEEEKQAKQQAKDVADQLARDQAKQRALEEERAADAARRQAHAAKLQQEKDARWAEGKKRAADIAKNKETIQKIKESIRLQTALKDLHPVSSQRYQEYTADIQDLNAQIEKLKEENDTLNKPL